mmetsp:Transcript_32819/g.49490  ORF Transcript_32819/g.49490 Transcript_32819/m.49490 type:complete len:95 (-) Transcript_32819:1529-1813(-)
MLPLKYAMGITGNKDNDSFDALRVAKRPPTKQSNDASMPASGPLMAISNKAARLGGKETNGVKAPKMPRCGDGNGTDGPNFTFHRLATNLCEIS